ncbi:M48 family metalloprotease [Caulobacter mirabilis]|uniref:M48 family metalloprotease n=1 Tax=Caulobacter mirabilis TaxID=69666 RepID=UPI0015598A17|nr:M48 family metalloprotease [Caulobacter mirabilis]
MLLAGCVSLGEIDQISDAFGVSPNRKRFEVSDPRQAADFLSTDAPDVFGAPPPAPRALVDVLARVSDRLQAATGREIAVEVWDCDALSAFATPAGRVVVCRSLLTELQYEDELAFVIAHEAAHLHLSHVSLLARLETRQQREWIRDFEGSTVLRNLTIAGTFAILFKSADALSDEIEERVGVSKEEDSNNDIDSVVIGLTLVGSVLFGDHIREGLMGLLDERRRHVRRMDSDAARKRSPEEELAADAYALSALRRAGYAPDAGGYLLSRLTGGAGGRIAAGKSRTWDHFSLTYEHPGADERVRRLVVSAVAVDPAPFDPCAGRREADRAPCEAWIAASNRADRSVGRLLAAAEAVADQGASNVERECRQAHAELSAAAKALGSDRALAATAATFSLLCPGWDWAALALAPAQGEASGGYYYLRQLGAVLWLKGRPGEAYDVTFVTADIAGSNALAFGDFVDWTGQVGLPEAADEARARCRTVADDVWTADKGRFCDLLRRAPGARVDIRRASGLPLDAKIGLLPMVKGMPEAFAMLDEDRKLTLARVLLSQSSRPGLRVESRNKVCLHPKRYALHPEPRSLAWFNPDTNCLALPAGSPSP